MNNKGQKAFNEKSDLEEAVDFLIDDICEKAEEVRSKVSISSASELWEFTDALQMFNDYVDRAYKCKSIKAVEKLRKKMEFAFA